MKLNERDKLSIKLLYATGASQSEIARRFRVSRFTINGVVSYLKKAKNAA